MAGQFICDRADRARWLIGTRNCPDTGSDYHKDGFGSPIGRWKETALNEGSSARLEFESGIIVEGKVEKMERRDGQLLLVSFSDCTAKLGDRILFDPAWGDLRHGGGGRYHFGL